MKREGGDEALMQEPDDSTWLDQIAAGDASVVPSLLERYRDRLRRMVHFRLDPRLAARFDASDVVQEALLAATGAIREYAQQRPVAFYPWLCRIAWERMTDLQRHHLNAQRRSVLREEQLPGSLSNASLCELTRQLTWVGPKPGDNLDKREANARLALAIDQLDPGQCEVILLRYLEQLSLADTAAVLNITADAVKMRQLRAMRHLREMLELEH
jgi:RNA polymerase sigma-70 factor (ECF subfamily)